MSTQIGEYPLDTGPDVQLLKKSVVRQTLGFEDYLRRGLLVLIALGLFFFMIYPLFLSVIRSFQDRTGAFVGFQNYINYFASPNTSTSLPNSLYISFMSMGITVILAFLYAYGLTRMVVPLRRIFQSIALLPIFIPSLVQALALIYWFGNNGIFSRTFGINIGLYGAKGIIMSEVFYAFPHAFIILSTALALADARLYEAAEALRTKGARMFFTITLPGAKYGLMSAAFVVFTLAITDFGAPKVVGGNYDVLATDIYNQVVGQQNFQMGATISTLLLIPALIAFTLDRIVQRRQVAMVSSQITPLSPKRHHPVAEIVVIAVIILLALFIIGVYATVILGAFIRYWPYDLSLSLNNFSFYTAGAHHRGGAFIVLGNSIRMALITAVAGTVIVFFSAYLIEKSRGLNLGRGILYLLSIMPLAIPGMVLGLSYIFTFNNPASPLYALYGTMTILVLSTVIHYYTVPFLTAMTALRQMDPEFEAIGESLEAPFYKTFMRVTVPVALPAIIQIISYYFLNAMVTISAVVFLFVPGRELAALSVMLLDDAGETAQAMALSLLIIVVGFTAKGLFWLLTRSIERTTQAWKVR
jgi:iron(III) transport system permease protein